MKSRWSRVTKWINRNLSAKVEFKHLGNAKYYEGVLDYIQEV